MGMKYNAFGLCFIYLYSAHCFKMVREIQGTRHRFGVALCLFTHHDSSMFLLKLLPERTSVIPLLSLSDCILTMFPVDSWGCRYRMKHGHDSATTLSKLSHAKSYNFVTPPSPTLPPALHLLTFCVILLAVMNCMADT